MNNTEILNSKKEVESISNEINTLENRMNKSSISLDNTLWKRFLGLVHKESSKPMFDNLYGFIKAFMVSIVNDYQVVYEIREVSIKDYFESLHIRYDEYRYYPDFMYIMQGDDKIYIDTDVNTKEFGRYVGLGSPLEGGCSTSSWWYVDDLTDDLEVSLKLVESYRTFSSTERRIKSIYKGISLK
jgi:hypothetical protein